MNFPSGDEEKKEEEEQEEEKIEVEEDEFPDGSSRDPLRSMIRALISICTIDSP